MSIDQPMTVVMALTSVMRAITHVGKDSRNLQQNFDFRGIDAVLNAVGPAFREFGIVAAPEVQTIEYGTVVIGARNTSMAHVRVTVKYTFTGPAGDSVTALVPAEAMDSGDKATSKAMSVAYRTALIQVLALPTCEADPDAVSYERSSPEPAVQPAPAPPRPRSDTPRARREAEPPSGEPSPAPPNAAADRAALAATTTPDRDHLMAIWREAERQILLDVPVHRVVLPDYLVVVFGAGRVPPVVTLRHWLIAVANLVAAQHASVKDFHAMSTQEVSA